MPELPDVEAYCAALRKKVVDQPLENVRLMSPFFLRSIEPAIDALEGRTVRHVERLGKRIVFGFDEDLFAVIHLMIAGRFRWLASGKHLPRKLGLAEFDFPLGTLGVTEAGSKRRASLHLVAGRAGLAAHDRGGLEPLTASVSQFGETLRRENHTLKRTLTDPRLFSGIGNAYSDEILHAAGLSPIVWTSRLSDAEIERLHAATIETLSRWTAALTAQFLKKFPGAGDVTAFREDFAVHGRFGKPCPVCTAPVQRIRYADNETNYCATCQTGGKVLADRSLSRLLKEDWPRVIGELEG
ncbi:MAG: formamidopyrimidine-DNA glycosylase [Phycisphaerales bacterium]|nr:formamidopyrimidine-DNA glycosylase [Phycisphaerales bacterium]MCB9857139.1 formamidopyrimidine-DNA glycosylase [Phycisphaerales bacterium]MCB9861734.1 formamidopyrimidine-DNA glycosylase [Phycisphaerales bacterium]